VKYNSSDGMSNEIITNTNSTGLTDLEPNTTYTLVVEGCVCFAFKLLLKCTGILESLGRHSTKLPVPLNG